jgi:hypothetical protein
MAIQRLSHDTRTTPKKKARLPAGLLSDHLNSSSEKDKPNKTRIRYPFRTHSIGIPFFEPFRSERKPILA